MNESESSLEKDDEQWQQTPAGAAEPFPAIGGGIEPAAGRREAKAELINNEGAEKEHSLAAGQRSGEEQNHDEQMRKHEEKEMATRGLRAKGEQEEHDGTPLKNGQTTVGKWPTERLAVATVEPNNGAEESNRDQPNDGVSPFR